MWVGNAASPTASFSGFRFANLAIPPGAVVTSARLELRAASQQWLSMNFEFAVEAVGEQRAVLGGQSGRRSARCSRSGCCTPPTHSGWPAPGISSTSWPRWCSRRSTSPGWAAGNALSVVVRGAGQSWARKFATAFESGAAYAPRLVVTFRQPPSTPSLSVSDVTVTEGNSGTTSAIFTVSLSASSTQTVTVTYATANGTAQSGTDFVAGTGRVTFAARADVADPGGRGQRRRRGEPNETFFVDLSGPTNATLADGQGIGTITNDDAGTDLPSATLRSPKATPLADSCRSR